MARRLIVVGVIATALAATSPIAAQPMQPPPSSAETVLVGLPVYSADGQKLGDVTQVSAADNQLVADFGSFLGLGPTGVIIPGALFVRKTDRIELKLSAAEVKDHLLKPQP
jgi:hypothetical protein